MGFSLADIPPSPLRSCLGNWAVSTGAIAVATAPAKVQIVSTINYVVDGVWGSVGATDNFWTLPATVSIVPAGGSVPSQTVSSAFGSLTDTVASTRYFFLGLTAAGAAVAYMSNPPNTAAASQDETILPDFAAGAANSSVTIVGIVKVTVAAGTVFTPATTSLSAAGVTTTYTNVSMLPVSLP